MNLRKDHYCNVEFAPACREHSYTIQNSDACARLAVCDVGACSADKKAMLLAIHITTVYKTLVCRCHVGERLA